METLPSFIFGPTIVSALILFFLALIAKSRSRVVKSSARLPPGPQGLPLLGNISDLPPPGKLEYLHWLKHKEIYGPISSVTVLGQTMILIHEKNIALELLEKRAAINSGRPKMKFALDMVGWAHAMSSLQNNALHRLYRKYAYKQIGSKTAISQYHSMQEAVVGRTLQHLREYGGKGLQHSLKTQTGSLILRVLYDYRSDQHNPDPLITLADVAMDHFSEATVPGRWLVDTIPMIAQVPDWLPGAGFKRTARVWRNHVLSCVDVPYNFVKQKSRIGTASTSFVSRSLDEAEAGNGGSALSEEQEHFIKWTAMSLYIGGEDTSAETLNAFFLAMSMFPKVQSKVQEEIDSVIGTQRLPNLGDREKLPYLNAVVDEALRWHPIVPFGVPHASDEEGHINGYRIPKSSIFLPNVWWFTRDPKVYHDPENFKPERYMEPYNEPSPRDFVFGFGRRRCPGSVLADSTLYLTFAQVLAAFDIVPAVHENGEAVTNVHSSSPGLISKVGPFSVQVKIRSDAHDAMLSQLTKNISSDESDAKYLDGLPKDL